MFGKDGDDLVFPAGAVRLTNPNNLGSADLSATFYDSLTFSGAGYTISGASGNLVSNMFTGWIRAIRRAFCKELYD